MRSLTKPSTMSLMIWIPLVLIIVLSSSSSSEALRFQLQNPANSWRNVTLSSRGGLLQSNSQRRWTKTLGRHRRSSLFGGGNDDNNDDSKPADKNKEESYQFGDITKGLIRQAKAKANEYTGKEEYQFGDLTKTSIQKASHAYEEFGNAVNHLTGSEEYHVGDLTKWLLQNTQEQVHQELDETATQLKRTMTFLTQRLIRFRSYLLVQIIRVVVKFQWERHVLRLLPTTTLLDIVSAAMEQEARPAILRVVSTELDKRWKVAVLKDENYQFGDLTKKAIRNFTGKPNYSFGDITRAILEKQSKKLNQRRCAQHQKGEDLLKSDQKYKEKVDKELQVFDEQLLDPERLGQWTKKAITNFTGNDHYEFGDITRRLLQWNKAPKEVKPPKPIQESGNAGA